MHQSQHVQTIRAQTLGWTHLKSMHVVRKRKARANDLYLPVMVSGLFQMRESESKALVQGWLWLEPTDWLLRWIIPTTSASICFEWRDSGAWISLVSLDLGTRRCPLRPSRRSCCFYALLTQIMSRWTFTARKLPRRAMQPGMQGWRIPGFFSIYSWFRSPPVNLRETVLPWFVWLALTVLKTAIRRPFWKFVTD